VWRLTKNCADLLAPRKARSLVTRKACCIHARKSALKHTFIGSYRVSPATTVPLPSRNSPFVIRICLTAETSSGVRGSSGCDGCSDRAPGAGAVVEAAGPEEGLGAAWGEEGPVEGLGVG
jgi:hypothetical protein